MALRLILLCSLVCLVSGKSRVRRIVGGQPADVPPPPSEADQFTTPEPEERDPLVFVKRDRRSAEVVGTRNPDGTYSFLGIRYAEPPIKRLRFVRPVRVKPRGTIDATKFGPPCPQWYYGRLIGQEDCLFLNVFTPEIPSGSANTTSTVSFPVLIWIHGGNFKTGSASQYVPTHLVKKGIVVVTVQYRLGSLGFLTLGRKELPGNAGLFDMSLAVRWVTNYIRFFGGDPERIISGGQGSGGSCASHLVLNSIVKNRLKGIIAMSGTPVSPFAIDESEVRSGKEVGKANNCTSEEGLVFVRCMQALPLDTVLRGDSSLEVTKKKESTVARKLSNLFGPGPAEEGKDDFRGLPNFILESPLEAISHGHFPKIPLLTGVTKQETSAGVKGNLLSELLKKLTSPSFLKEGIFKELLDANTGLYVNKKVNPSLSKLFDSSQYLQFFTSLVSSALGDVGQIIEHTTDALFNLPAFILSTFWSQRSNVFLYSFEHMPSKPQAMNILNGIALVSNQSSELSGDNKEPSHGDDLIYLFEIRSLEGEPISDSESQLTIADKKVREHFTTAVVEFAKTGTPKTEGGDPWKPFNPKEGNYMIIEETPKLAKNFRKCQIGLWTGDTDLLGSSECALKGATEIVTNTLGAAGTGLLKTVGLDKSVTAAANKVGDTVKNRVDSLTNPVYLPSIGGGLISSGNKRPQVSKQSALLGRIFK